MEPIFLRSAIMMELVSKGVEEKYIDIEEKELQNGSVIVFVAFLQDYTHVDNDLEEYILDFIKERADDNISGVFVNELSWSAEKA